MKDFIKKTLIFIVAFFVAIIYTPISSLAYSNAHDNTHSITYGNTKESRAKDALQTASYPLILVKFSDAEEFTDGFSDKLLRTLNTSMQSVKNYFYQMSNGSYTVEMTLAQKVINLESPTAYYMPKYYFSLSGEYIEVNALGYDNRYFDSDNNPCSPETAGGKQHIDRFLREQSLIRDVVSDATFKEDFIPDNNSDGLVDGLMVVFKMGEQSTYDLSWNDILWQHKSNLSVYDEALLSSYYIPDEYEISPFDFTPARINQKVVSNFVLFSEDQLSRQTIIASDSSQIFSPSIICHELMHDLGAADYYYYTKAPTDTYEDEPVGELDIMGSTGMLPQMPLTYTRYKLGFLGDDAILPVTKSGNYTLFPVTYDNGVKALKLVTDDYQTTGDYFMIEARDNSGSFIDSTLSDEGIIVYRINEKNGHTNKEGVTSSVNYGNMYGNNEVYVYRLGNSQIYSNNKSYAFLNGKNNRLYNSAVQAYVDNSTIGNTDKSADKSVIEQNTGLLVTSLWYSDDSNSGVKIDSITKNADGSYSFNIVFDDEDRDFGSTYLTKYYDGTTIALWQGGSRSEKVKFYAVEACDIVKYKNERYALKKEVTAQMLEDGSVYSKKAVFIGEFDACYQRAFIADFEQMTAIFAVLDGESYYFGVVNPQAPSFIEYLFGTTKWMIMIIGTVVFFLGVFIVGVVFMSRKKSLPKKAANINADVNETHLKEEEIYGENYWMRDGDFYEVQSPADSADEDNDTNGDTNINA